MSGNPVRSNRRSRGSNFALCLSPILFALSSFLGGPGVGAENADRESATAGGDLLVYAGTYTGTKSKGIYVFRLDSATGKATPPQLAVETRNPSFLALHPGRKFLYAVSEAGGPAGGRVSGFSIDEKSGRLAFLNQESSMGEGPCYLVVDRTGKNVLVANYGSGGVAVLPIGGDGRLGPASCHVSYQGSSVHPDRQKAPHAHSVNLDPGNRFAVVADLGIDRLLVCPFEPERGNLVFKDPPGDGAGGARVPLKPGAGPRHFAFHPGGRFAYVINEINCTVTAFSYDGERGELKEVQSITTLPGKLEGGYSTAEVQVHPSGKFLYGSNRGHDSIAVFAIDREKGTLTPVEHQPTGGKTPRNFGIDPAGKYLLAANQGSDTIVVFRIDPDRGSLKATGEVIEVPSPVCVKFLPAR
jgi:6-phosphogluconolactonase